MTAVTIDFDYALEMSKMDYPVASNVRNVSVSEEKTMSAVVPGMSPGNGRELIP